MKASISAPAPAVSMILVSYNNPDVLCATLASLSKAIDTPTIEIIVVDNASAADNVRRVREQFPSVVVVPLSTNSGFGAGCNAGAECATGEVLLFVNSDILLTGNPLPAMLELLTSETVGVVGCQLLNDDGSLQPSSFRFPGVCMRLLQVTGMKDLLLRLVPRLRFRQTGNRSVGFVSGAFLMIPKGLFQSVGGFDPTFFMYVEDADLCYRVRQTGRTIVLCGRKDVIHLGRHYEDRAHPMVFKEMHRGLLRFYAKHLPRWKQRLLVRINRFDLARRRLVNALFLRDSGYAELLRECRKLYANHVSN